MEKYPPWLDRQAAGGSSSSGLSPEDLERYKAQYDCITQLVAAYESEPGNTAKIMALLQEVRAGKAVAAAAAGAGLVLRGSSVSQLLCVSWGIRNCMYQASRLSGC